MDFTYFIAVGTDDSFLIKSVCLTMMGDILYWKFYISVILIVQVLIIQNLDQLA